MTDDNQLHRLHLSLLSILSVGPATLSELPADLGQASVLNTLIDQGLITQRADRLWLTAAGLRAIQDYPFSFRTTHPFSKPNTEVPS